MKAQQPFRSHIIMQKIKSVSHKKNHDLQIQIENAQNILLHSNQEKQEMMETAIELLIKVLQQEEDDDITIKR